MGHALLTFVAVAECCSGGSNGAYSATTENGAAGTTRTVELTNEGAGFGMVLIEGPPPQVSEIRPDTPAYNCNQIFENDILVRVNGNLVAGKTHDEIIDIISQSQTVSFTLESNETAPPKADARMHKEIVFNKGGGPIGLKIESMDHGGACIRGCVPNTPAATTGDDAMFDFEPTDKAYDVMRTAAAEGILDLGLI